MADLLACPSCYAVRIPSCFTNLVLTLPDAGTYDAVFTNHFGKKKVIEVSTEDDGSLSIAAAIFPSGYFTSFNPVTLEFFAKAGGGYIYGDVSEESCSAVTVCGTKVCYSIEFYDTEDANETVTIKCCEDYVAPECDIVTGMQSKVITTDESGNYTDTDFIGKTIRVVEYGSDIAGTFVAPNFYSFDSTTGTITGTDLVPETQYLIFYE